MEAGLVIAIGQISAKVLSTIWKYYSDVKDAESEITLLARELEDFCHVVVRILWIPTAQRLL